VAAASAVVIVGTVKEIVCNIRDDDYDGTACYTTANGLKSWTALIKGRHKNKMAVVGQYKIVGRHKQRTTMSERPFVSDNRPPPPTFPRDQFFSASIRRCGGIHKKKNTNYNNNNNQQQRRLCRKLVISRS